jgi:hypothetical protein
MPKKTREERKQQRETFKVKGEELLKKVREIIQEGNVRRLIIQDSKHKTLIEFPLTVGVVISVLLPALAAIGAIAALISECTITVIRDKK